MYRTTAEQSFRVRDILPECSTCCDTGFAERGIYCWCHRGEFLENHDGLTPHSSLRGPGLCEDGADSKGDAVNEDKERRASPQGKRISNGGTRDSVLASKLSGSRSSSLDIPSEHSSVLDRDYDDFGDSESSMTAQELAYEFGFDLQGSGYDPEC